MSNKEQLARMVGSAKSLPQLITLVKTIATSQKELLQKQGYDIKVIKTKYKGEVWDAILMRELK